MAYSRLLAPGISYSESSIGRIVSSPSVRKTGMGKKLMEESIDQIKNLFQNGYHSHWRSTISEKIL